ncbi:MAG: 2-amino-4-hydroxy-6-hydroxymethyldihydropteridine diphosphokinase [Gammaproteobacteria bacterium]
MRLPNPPDAVSVGVRAYIGLGSNLDEPAAQLRRAFMELDRLPQTRVLARSHLYKSKPLGPQDQPDFCNAVAVIETQLEPLTLLRGLRDLEERHGRRRESETHWGPRTLDLDMLIYGELSMHTPQLTLPHPGVHQRSFALYPLAEVAPALVIPGHGPVQGLRDRCHSPSIEKYEDSADE